MKLVERFQDQVDPQVSGFLIGGLAFYFRRKVCWEVDSRSLPGKCVQLEFNGIRLFFSFSHAVFVWTYTNATIQNNRRGHL